VATGSKKIFEKKLFLLKDDAQELFFQISDVNRNREDFVYTEV
jgi:hypothetical protein